MITRNVERFVDNFNRAQVFSTTPGHNGWTIEDTSAAGTPTYLCIGSSGGAAKLTLANTSEAEIVVLSQADVLTYDLERLQHLWWVAKVEGIDSVTTLALGMASAQNDVLDTVSNSAWFRLEGSASTSALVVETDDGVVDNNDVATGKTLGSTYKKLLLDFTNGPQDVRFFVDGERVAVGTQFDMSRLTAELRFQPYVQLQKGSGTGVASVTIAQFGVQYESAY